MKGCEDAPCPAGNGSVCTSYVSSDRRNDLYPDFESLGNHLIRAAFWQASNQLRPQPPDFSCFGSSGSERPRKALLSGTHRSTGSSKSPQAWASLAETAAAKVQSRFHGDVPAMDCFPIAHTASGDAHAILGLWPLPASGIRRNLQADVSWLPALHLLAQRASKSLPR